MQPKDTTNFTFTPLLLSFTTLPNLLLVNV